MVAVAVAGGVAVAVVGGVAGGVAVAVVGVVVGGGPMTTSTTHSSRGCVARCPRQYQFRYIHALVPDRESDAARLGSVVHDGLHGLNTVGLAGTVEEIMVKYAKVPLWMHSEDMDKWWSEQAKAIELVVGYDQRWGRDQYEVVLSEEEFAIPIEGYKHTTTMRGKIDRLVRVPDGRLALLETKTVGEDLSPGADYWTTWRYAQQTTGYVVALRRLGYDVSFVIADAIRRPSIRLKKAETPQEYGLRLREDIASRPDFYYARMEFARTQDELDAFERELDEELQVLDLRYEHDLWTRRTQSCLRPFKCSYLPICTFERIGADEVPDGYKKLDNPHSELEMKDVSTSDG